MAEKAIIEIQYFPPIAYFALMVKYGELIIESQENYQKQTYRNRCRILTANKVDNLIVPAIKNNKNRPIRDVQIDYNQKWINRHLRAIKSGYGKSPFFEHYEPYIHHLIEKKHTFLFDKNLEIIDTLITLLEIKVKITYNSVFKSIMDDNCDDYRNAIHPKSMPGFPVFFNPEHYPQLFGIKFENNLSILDILFCEGPNANNIIHSSINS